MNLYKVKFDIGEAYAVAEDFGEAEQACIDEGYDIPEVIKMLSCDIIVQTKDQEEDK